MSTPGSPTLERSRDAPPLSFASLLNQVSASSMFSVNTLFTSLHTSRTT